jgi:hypothetical protein
MLDIEEYKTIRTHTKSNHHNHAAVDKLDRLTQIPSEGSGAIQLEI